MIPAEILRKVRQIHIRTKHLVADVFAGEYHSVFKGKGMEFQEVREYVPGDEIRSIDWNVTARMGHPYVKVLTEERELTVMLLVDLSASLRFGSQNQTKKEVAAELASLLALAAITNNDRVGLILFTDQVEKYVPPRKGISHVLRIIREVLAFEAQHRATALQPALDFLNHVCPRRAVVFILSDFLVEDQARRALQLTARRHDVIGLLIQDPREMELIPAGVVEWEDLETGRRYVVDTSARESRTRYEEFATRHYRDVREMFEKARADYLTIVCGQPYDRALTRFFQMRERRLRI